MSKKEKAFAKGSRVKFVRRNGELGKGKVTGTESVANGVWVHIDCGELGVIKARPSMLTKF